MSNILHQFSFDRISFWLGFLTGVLFLWFFGRLRPVMRRGWERLGYRLAEARAGLTASTELRHRNDTLRYAQRVHMAAPLFSLDEILVEPRLLAPPTRIQPGNDPTSDDESQPTLPYLPDWPELGTYYEVASLSLAQALSGGANLAVIGQPGSGKTVALAHLACQLARREPVTGDLSHHLPILVHIADVLPENQYISGPLDLLQKALIARASTLTSQRLPELLNYSFHSGRAMLLLDGLDEVPPALLAEGVNFLKALLDDFPGIRMVVAASTEDFSGLTTLGLIPIPMATWGARQRQEFIRLWSDQWKRYVATSPDLGTEQVDPTILVNWLLGDDVDLTPFEFSLKVWAAFAGDILGPSPAQSVEAYLRRMTADLPDSRVALEDLAIQMILTSHPYLTFKEARSWVGEVETLENPTEGEILAENESTSIPRPARTIAKHSGKLLAMLDNGLLIEKSEERMTFNHPSICAYLAAARMAKTRETHGLEAQPGWTGKSATLAWMAALGDVNQLVERYLHDKDDPLQRGPFIVARWLHLAPKNSPWRAATMRYLAGLIQKENLAMGLRARALSGLLDSGDPGVGVLFRQLVDSPSSYVRQMAALGLGFLHDTQSIPNLATQLDDLSREVKWAACQALVAIGDQRALENLATSLLHGDEEARRFAAEALARHPTEAQGILEEGSTMEDLLVRRAVVFGLAKIHQPWARQVLEKMAIDDKEWVVRAAASNALESFATQDNNVPVPFPALSETPWLIAFAGERGVGISPEQGAMDLLLMAAKEGNPSQRLAALQTIGQVGDARAVSVLIQILEESDGKLRESAFNALWQLAASGVKTINVQDVS